MNDSKKPKLEADGTAKQLSGIVSAWVYAFAVLAISVGLLACNSFFCYMLVGSIPLPTERVTAAVITQLVYYLLPIALTFFQWYLIDQLRRSLSA